LDQLSDPLAKLDEIMDWSPFVSIINEARPDRTKQGAGGRPPISSLVLFKGLLIGEIYHLSNDQIEYQITDRASFARFCGLKLGERAPDANSFWLLKEALKKTGKYDDLFKALLETLSRMGLKYSKCAIVDATFIEAPRNRSIKKRQREILKERSHNPGVEIPFELDLAQHESLESHLPETERAMSHKLRQTDVDAMWSKKGDEVHFGYKDHIAVDSATKLIIAHEVTPANTADVDELVGLVPEGTEEVYDDAGYVGEGVDCKLKKNAPMSNTIPQKKDKGTNR
jgi:IS5 family transposase